MNRKKKSGCPSCNSGIEKMQYGHMQLEDQMILIDATELAHIDMYIENGKKEEYEQIEVKDDKQLIMIYGVIVPQAGKNMDDIVPMLDKYKNYAFACLTDGKCYLSTYEDIVLFPYLEDESDGHIPFAGLFRTDLQINNNMEFAYSLYLRYENMDILDNVLIRDFVIALKRQEETYTNKIVEWKSYINMDSLIMTACEIV